MFAGWLVHNTAFQVVLILVMSLWFFGWVGTLFLSSTRVIFAAAFDRVLPDRAAEVSEKRKVPFYSLILMLLPAVGLSAVYAYNATFVTYTLDATLVIAVTYLFSSIAVVILPWRKPDLWRASPASKIKVLGVPHRARVRGDHHRAARLLPLRVADATTSTGPTSATRCTTWARCTCWPSSLTWWRGSSAGGRASTSA